jgi:RHS repeat-associated protein
LTVKGSTEQEYYFTFDGHGSTRVLLDFTGAIAQLYSFDAYGNAIGFDPSVALTEFLYSGEQFDSKIGQQYLRQRYYDPTTGRFNRLDPFFGTLNDPQSFHKYLYTHANPVNGIDPNGEFFSAIGILSVSGIQGHLRAGTGYIRAAFSVYNTVGKLFKLIEYGKQISSLFKIARTSLDLVNAGTPLPSAFVTSITQVFNVDANFTNLNKLFSIFDAIMPEVANQTGKDPKKVFEQLFKDILLSIPSITSKVMVNATQIAKISAGNIAHEDFVLVFGLPSPPSGFTHDLSMWIPVKVHGEDYAIGWSKYSGVLFDLGLAVKNPKSPTFKNSFPLWANKNFQSIARIDYWDYDGGWAYRPHYHTWGEKAHHYLDERYI